MKKFLITLALFLAYISRIKAQHDAAVYQTQIPNLQISRSVTLHFISPEPITYVDISSPRIVGDLPLKNILRLKLVPDSVIDSFTARSTTAIVTIIGESFIAQYRLSLSEGASTSLLPVHVEIRPENTRPIDVQGVTLTTPEIRKLAMGIIGKAGKNTVRKTEAFGIHAKVNGIHAVGDLLFMDISFHNRTNLPYDIDELRFKIEDRKITKATNVQSVEMVPLWKLEEGQRFTRKFRNIYVFRKTTFPGNKALNIELSEKQISGRNLVLQVKYKDVLSAEAL